MGGKHSGGRRAVEGGGIEGGASRQRCCSSNFHRVHTKGVMLGECFFTTTVRDFQNIG